VVVEECRRTESLLPAGAAMMTRFAAPGLAAVLARLEEDYQHLRVGGGR
jgi:hypothetical protein